MERTIREARKNAGLSQQYMAEKLGVSRQTYASFENHPDKVTISQAKRICAILGEKYERIFFGMFAS